MTFDPNNIKKDFPIFSAQYHGNPLVYLDSAATTQKPRIVIDKMTDFYFLHNANIHRGIYRLSEDATSMYESVRDKVALFIGAENNEIIFTAGATDSSNMLVSMLKSNILEGDEIVMSPLEHHSTLIPWQECAEERGARIRFVSLTNFFTIDKNQFEKDLSDKTKIVVITHVSNITGVCSDVLNLVKITRARAPRAIIVLDASQSVPHMPVSAKKLGIDFMYFSAHKMCGPTGVGVLYGKYEILKTLSPVRFGGGMINDVKKYKSTWAPVPHCFEAGTPNIAGVIGLGTACSYLSKIGMDLVYEHEKSIASYVRKRLSEIPNVHLYDFGADSTIINFNVMGVHPHDVAAMLDEYGITVRAGHHCAHLLSEENGLPATLRASFYIYTTEADIDTLIIGIKKVHSVLL